MVPAGSGGGNAKRSSRSLRFSRLCLGVGVPSGGSAAPVYREHPLGLYVLLPCSNASAPSLDPGEDVESSVEKWEFKRHAPPKPWTEGLGCTGCRLVQESIRHRIELEKRVGLAVQPLSIYTRRNCVNRRVSQFVVLFMAAERAIEAKPTD
jgi:hypothetical protein